MKTRRRTFLSWLGALAGGAAVGGAAKPAETEAPKLRGQGIDLAYDEAGFAHPDRLYSPDGAYSVPVPFIERRG